MAIASGLALAVMAAMLFGIGTVLLGVMGR
jgi:hypothetical protein